MTTGKLLAGEVAIVTGGGAGIGESVASYFGEQGARVIVLDRDGASAQRTAESIVQSGGDAVALEADVRDAAALARCAAVTAERFGEIDILINNAGIYPRHSFVDMTEAQWDEIQDVNLKGTFQMTKAVVPYMLQRKRGRIVNISSVTFHLGMARLSHYVAAKGGVIGFTRALARELGPEGIAVNCITPGAIKTQSEATVVTEDEANAVIPLQSLRRRLLPIDVAKVCLFLSCDLSGGMTGQTLNVDGGWIMY